MYRNKARCLHRVFRVFWFFLAVLTLLGAPQSPVMAQQAPAWSRGQQHLPVKVSEASKRAVLALQAEGYTVTNQSGPSEESFYVAGQKANHTAIIMCTESPGPKSWVNIVVASASGDSNVPGRERQKLQARMDQLAVSGNPPAPTSGSADLTGKWKYDDPGAAQDEFDFQSNGKVKATSGSEGDWQVAGNELVIHWPNGWTNRLRLPAERGVLSGQAISPDGSRRSQITLSRLPGQGLQARVDTPRSESTGMSGDWFYRDGSFQDTFSFSPDGKVIAKTGLTGTWSIKERELIVTWPNGWMNRLQLPAVEGRLSGVAVSPSQERRPITLSRK